MKKKKHHKQSSIFQEELTESGATVNLPILIGCSAESFADLQRDFSEDESAAVMLRLGGGTVRTARITSKGIPFGRKHYNSEYIQTFLGREVLIHEVGGKIKAYLYDETSKLLMRIICVVDMSRIETDRKQA